MLASEYRQPLKFCVTTLLLIVSALPFTVHAQTECNAETESWRCYGSFEVKFESYSGPMTARATHFNNGEFRAEIEMPGTKKEYLKVLPSNLELFSGLAEGESINNGEDNPFLMFNKVFTNPLIALQKAHPAGPASVQYETTISEIMLENHYPATLSTIRQSSDLISFTLIVPDYPSPKIEGIWAKGLYEPLADDFPLGDWFNNEDINLRNLQEARAWVYKPEVDEETGDQ